jgi:hypothetical protein
MTRPTTAYWTTPRTVAFVPTKTNAPAASSFSLLSQIGFTCPFGANGLRFPDQRLCNMYFTCTSSGLPEPSLCPEGYLFSDLLRDCDLASRVHCGSRLSAFVEPEEVRTSTSPIAVQSGTIECILGDDGYFEDPLYCNVYHHCLAGVDYREYCPNQLAWNEKKKMCDW